MKITPDQAPGAAGEALTPAATPNNGLRTSTPSSTASKVEHAATTAGTAVVTPLQRQTDVTFRRDVNGRIYYVISDAHSGQEILEVPPKTIRELGESIDEYLKQQQSKASVHVEEKA